MSTLLVYKASNRAKMAGEVIDQVLLWKDGPKLSGPGLEMLRIEKKVDLISSALKGLRKDRLVEGLG
jgi:hypothetical protein